MLKKLILLIITFFLFLVFFIIGFVYSLQQTNFYIRTDIVPIDEATYEALEDKEYFEDSKQENFRQLKFIFKCKYAKKVENIEIMMPYSFRELLSSTIYQSGDFYKNNDLKHRTFIYREEAILYTGEVSEQEILELLSKGVLKVTYLEEGIEKEKEFPIGESVELK